MLINGEKYACEACVRGHRVSSCSHSERKLLHVNKKGRPVSQCPHCRSLRKNRSQHVKCECQDKSHAKEDCPHLKDLQQDGQGDSPPKPYLDTVPEDLPSLLQQQQKENRKSTGPNVNQHDSRPTIFTNGHHKPVHKFNDAHNHCGAPYRIPSRSHSHHGPSHRELAQRSTDSLPSMNRALVHHESPLHNVLNASHAQRQARSEHNSPLLAPTSNPSIPFQVEIPPLDPNAYSYSPFDAQSPSVGPAPQFPENIPEDWFTTHDDAHNYGPPAVPELAYIDWSKYGFGGTPQMNSPGNMKNLYGDVANSQVPSYATSMEHLNQLTGSGFNTPSADVSEVDDLPTNLRPTAFRTISHASNDMSSTGATEDDISHRYSNSSSYYGTPAGNALANGMGDLDIDKFIAETSRQNRSPQQVNQYAIPPSTSLTPEIQQQQFFQPPYPQQQRQHPVQQPSPPRSQHQLSTPPESILGFSITSHPSPPESTGLTAPYSIREAQAQAHARSMPKPNLPTELPRTLSNPDTFEDPMWCAPDVDLYGVARGFNLDDEREDEQWAK
ncbi:hypothetical protein LTR05_006051 [Lithohypha guttulata]|uniref:Copper-fist domain-containing protein n=1 Tax=Lithohypha guttulata TaxID=1690604 RepID=A0AAN7Y5F7_9EURO|nr:hypothetical protein LTR05_006051 [Lithohypha guttulata]